MTSRISEIDAQIAKLHAEKETLLNEPKYSKPIQDYIDRNNVFNNFLDVTDYWDIYGEDPNCDFGGYHHEPFLETVQGKLINAIAYATKLKGFYTWGAGGKIRKSNRGTVKRV